MALNRKELITLAKAVSNSDKKAAIAFRFEDKEYSYAALNETLRDELNELAGSYNAYRRNKNDIFEIMQEVIDEVVVKKVYDRYAAFAEIKQYGQGNKPSFSKRTGKNRAKQFITKVGLAGIYEVFKLDTETFSVESTAFGGAAQIGLEEFLDGAVDFTELIDIVIEGLDDAFYGEILKALEGMYTALPAANKATVADAFVEASMDDLLLKANALGGDSVIMTTMELASKIVPADGWISDRMKDEKFSQGYLGNYKTHKVIVLPQSYTDETLGVKVANPGYAYILPSNAKPVKVALEGETIVDEFVNSDRSREIQAYKKFGVALVTSNDLFVYRDESLAL